MFDRKRVAQLSAAHLAHDVYPAFLGVLLPLLIDELGLSLAAAGILASTLRWTTSLQPFLGHLADRTDTRAWVIYAPAVTAACMSLVGVAPNTTTVVILLLLTGMSHAAFHPSGGALVTRVSGDEWGRGTAWFMTGGEIGRVIGPVFIAGVIALGGLRLSPIAVIPGLFTTVLLYKALRHAPALYASTSARANVREALTAGKRPVLMLSAAVFLRSSANVTVVIFYPTLITASGGGLLLAGVGVGLYEVGAVAGAFVGGVLSDRFGRNRVMLIGAVIGAPPIVAALYLGATPLGFALLVLGGFGWLSATSIELVTMQELLPNNRSAAVGITYFVKAAGAIVATIVIGLVGEFLGLLTALTIAMVVGLACLPFLFFTRDPSRDYQTG
jgi:FSR family fosmidomycin resistance protein-like MFS transporter